MTKKSNINKTNKTNTAILKSNSNTSSYTLFEEILHSLTHGIGALLALVGMTILLVLSSLNGTLTHIISYSVYGLSLICLYTSSTLYHAIPNEKAKRFFKVCDHASIFLLIAGSYTPFLLLNLQGALGWSLMVIIWGLAFIGLVFKFFYTGRFRYASTLIYLGMGWLILVVIKPLAAALSTEALTWTVAGGVTYSVGTLFYLQKKWRFHHVFWHLFVLAGSICHYVAIFYASNLL